MTHLLSWYFVGISHLLSWYFAGIADIMGRRFGSIKIPYNKKKSWAGSISMFIFGFLISMGWVYESLSQPTRGPPNPHLSLYPDAL